MKTVSSKHLLPGVLLTASLVTAVSCLDNSTTPPVAGKRVQIAKQATADEGHYRVMLTAVNPSLAPNANAEGEIEIEGNDFRIKLDVNGVAANIRHAQHVHLGTACPTLDDDANGDGVIAGNETDKAGNVFFPLDSDLNSQAAGGNTFPTADNAGHYVYQESASLSSMLSDLGVQSLDLEGKVVEVHGIAADEVLPDSADTTTDLVPIACGVIQREDAGGTTGGTTGDGGVTTTTTGGKGGSDMVTTTTSGGKGDDGSMNGGKDDGGMDDGGTMGGTTGDDDMGSTTGDSGMMTTTTGGKG